MNRFFLFFAIFFAFLPLLSLQIDDVAVEGTIRTEQSILTQYFKEKRDYSEKEISRSIMNGYRPIAWIGFALGTGYQFGLLKVMVNVVFKNVENVKTYNFDVKAFCIALPVFIISYELIMLFFSTRIKKLTIKSVMLEG